MKKLNPHFLTLSFILLMISACSTGPKTLPTQLSTQSYLASDAGFATASHLIVGPRDAILVDAQFTLTDAKKVVEMIKASQKNLTHIFVTHGHPDHYFGLEEIKKAFPKAKVLATPMVIADIKATAPAKLAFWKKQYKAEMPRKIVNPEPFIGTELDLNGEKIFVYETGKGESDHAVVLYVPGLKALIAGDLIYNKVHLWLAENHPNEWLKNLEEVKTWAQSQGGVERILPGHGQNGSSDLFAENRDYIQAFVASTHGETTKKQSVDTMVQKFGDYKLPMIVDLSVGARVKK